MKRLEPEKVVLSLEERLQYLSATLGDVQHADQIVEFISRGLLYLSILLVLSTEVGFQFDALLHSKAALMHAGAQIEQVSLFAGQRIVWVHADLVHMMTSDLHIMIHLRRSPVGWLSINFVRLVVVASDWSGSVGHSTGRRTAGGRVMIGHLAWPVERWFN